MDAARYHPFIGNTVRFREGGRGLKGKLIAIEGVMGRVELPSLNPADQEAGLSMCKLIPVEELEIVFAEPAPIKRKK